MNTESLSISNQPPVGAHSKTTNKIGVFTTMLGYGHITTKLNTSQLMHKPQRMYFQALPSQHTAHGQIFTLRVSSHVESTPSLRAQVYQDGMRKRTNYLLIKS